MGPLYRTHVLSVPSRQNSGTGPLRLETGNREGIDHYLITDPSRRLEDLPFTDYPVIHLFPLLVPSVSLPNSPQIRSGWEREGAQLQEGVRGHVFFGEVLHL